MLEASQIRIEKKTMTHGSKFSDERISDADLRRNTMPLVKALDTMAHESHAPSKASGG